MPKLEPLKIVVRGKHDTGKTTVASLIKMFLEENDFRNVKIQDLSPLPTEKKDKFETRFLRNRKRPVRIIVELED